MLPSTINCIYFNFPDFSDTCVKYQGLTLEKDSTRVRNVIELTKISASKTVNSRTVGRATYPEPVHLWDATTGRLTDFDTHFSFIIKTQDQKCYGNGITFFLAPFGSKIPTKSGGGYLGLMSSDIAKKNLKKNQIVAVEFDTFQNPWDPSPDHVGINVNSIVSVANISWNTSMKDGKTANAWISYNSTTKNISVFLTYDGKPFSTGDSMLYHIVDLREVLPERVSIGFSASTGTGIESHRVLSWRFNSNLKNENRNEERHEGLRGQPNERTPSNTINDEVEDKSASKLTSLVVSLSTIAVVCGICFALCIWLKKMDSFRNSDDDTANFDAWMDDVFEKGTGPKRFSYRELVNATSNFDEGGKLGQGGFGGVYKGFLSDTYVAIKRISKGSKQGKKEYQSEVRVISQLRHRNLVQLLGWCHERNELLLVYEFMPNRSLDKHLFQGENVLTWEVRYRIALNLASVLLYLHEKCEQCVVHRDIKSSNVMLDSDFNAKLSDFGLARLVDHNLGSQTTVLAGTRGYLAPECYRTGKSSKESDVYSFGIVALEIACGRRPVEATRGVLVDSVWGLYGSGNIIEAADERLKMKFNELEMEHLLVVGLWCAHPDYKSRPSVIQVINVLKFESPLPKLPLELPTPVYHPTAPSLPDIPSLAGLTDTLAGR